MSVYKEDHLEEQEFQLLTSYEQQRYMRKLQEFDERFREIKSQLKNNWNNDQEYIDNEFIESQKELFDDLMSHSKHQVLTWKDRNSGKESLSARLNNELDSHLKEFMNLYSSIKEELNMRDSGKPSEKAQLDDCFSVKFEADGKVESEIVVSELKDKIEELQNQIDTMYKANRIVGENLDSLRKENEDLKEQNITIVTNNVKGLQDMQKQNCELKDQLNSKMKENTDLKIQNNYLQGEIKI